jgi:four helix bundle protein
MKSGPLAEKSYALSVAIVLWCKALQETKREYILTKQLIRSTTSVGANIEEASQAQSRADFIAKLSISLKEAHETRYWLRLLRDTHYCSPQAVNPHIQSIHEIIKLLVASLKTMRNG